jgi:hypothetical protein
VKLRWPFSWNRDFPLADDHPVVINRHVWHEHATMVATAQSSGYYTDGKWHGGHCCGGSMRWWTNPDTGEVRYDKPGPPETIEVHHGLTEEDLKRTRWEVG